MQVTIRNQRLLRTLGFTPSGDPTKGFVGLSVRSWLEVIGRRIAQMPTSMKIGIFLVWLSGFTMAAGVALIIRG